MRLAFVYILFFLITLSGCDVGPKSGRGFTLPDGDIDRGRAAFVQFECNACHAIENVEQLTSVQTENNISVKLGGKVVSIQTYGQLATSIVNPSHRLKGRYSGNLVSTADGKSLMRNYNDVMTVTELIDLVAFLQSNYEIKPYERARD